VDDALEARIDELSALAPLHNPRALVWLRAARRRWPDTPQFAVFDTAFYAGLPARARTYALPAEQARDPALRRYGFHGTAHHAMWADWCTLRPDLDRGGRLISLQLGGGCSVTATAQGRPRDTSMGFSPLAGLVMATRSGDLDPGLVLHLLRSGDTTAAGLEHRLNHEAGLKGLSGTSGDMRELLAADDERAHAAVDLYCYRARKYLGAYAAALEGVDGIVFGGGVGENAAAVRSAILAPMAWLGVHLDPDANADPAAAGGRITTADSPVEARVVAVDEGRILAGSGRDLMQHHRQQEAAAP
jgi:acetate kinase